MAITKFSFSRIEREGNYHTHIIYLTMPLAGSAKNEYVCESPVRLYVRMLLSFRLNFLE